MGHIMEQYLNTMELTPHQQRVVDEKAELDAKRKKLGEFKNTKLFANLPWQEQERLNTQAHIMTMYSAILTDRIMAFPRPTLTEADSIADLNGTPRPGADHVQAEV